MTKTGLTIWAALAAAGLLLLTGCGRSESSGSADPSARNQLILRLFESIERRDYEASSQQAVKLRVRDAVLSALAPKLAGVQSADEAGEVLAGNLPLIQQAAEQAAEGRPVRVSLGEERYPTRDYAGFSLPAGRYRSLRVVLGEGQGHNWWCVVFPPVCLSAAEKEAMQPVMNPDDYALITREDGWEIRFRVVELWGKLFNIFFRAD